MVLKQIKKEDLPVLFLRLGLGLSFLYPGISMFREPDAWIGWLPPSFLQLPPIALNPKLFLYLVGLFDFIIGIFFLGGFLLPLVTILASLHLLAILLFSGTTAYLIIFRDIGLFSASLALYLLITKKH